MRIGITIAAVAFTSMTAHAQVTKYVRFQSGADTAYGVLEGETIRELRGDLFRQPQQFTGRRLRFADVRLLAPVAPAKVIAVGLNYKSHLGERPAAAYPGLFTKYPTSIIPTNADIVLPADATNAHYEGEMVVVIGKPAHNVSIEDAKSYVFGVTAGNDVSERDWQRADLQWFRAKASDTFGPIGPVLVTGLNYDDLLLQTRLNGTVVQSQRTKDLIFSVSEIVSYVSRYVTLVPGDVIFTGTPGTTRQMKPGDVVEVELEGVGVLRNPVTQVPAPSHPQHDRQRPQPLVLAPPAQTLPVPPPSDAVVLFDGTSLANWRRKGTDAPAGWKVENGYMEVVPGTGDIESRFAFGDAELHVEFMIPPKRGGSDQDAGNSGVYLMGLYEVQVLDSYDNVTYPDGQNAALYGDVPPRVNVSRPPAEWQSFDITFTAPRFDAAGKLVSPARMTVLHNGVRVHDDVPLKGRTTHRTPPIYEAHPSRLPMSLQDHDHPVRFRNIWVRER